MMSKEQHKGLLVTDIENMKSGQFEQMRLIATYSLSSYIKSLIAFGGKSNVTKDNLNVIKEMFNILKTERALLNFILKNIDNINLDSTEEIILAMDDLNDKTVEYYYSVINDIEDAVDLKEERRGIRPRKNFTTLDKDSSYVSDVMALAESKESIQEFLGYEKEFWEYIKDKDYGVEVPTDIAENISYVHSIMNPDGTLYSMRLLIPDIIDLRTALLAIRSYVRAYNLYKSIGKEPAIEDINDYADVQEAYINHLETKGTYELKLKNVK